MLTIQSNLKMQDLETLSKTLVKPDIINFGLNKVGGGYTDEIADKVIAKLSKLGKDKTVVIINDITLQMADKLLEAGYKNIYLAFGSFNKDGTVLKDKTVYNIMKAVIENNIKEKLNAISLEEIFNMKIDLVIANPPYKKIGANITKKIIDDVDFDQYINLLPANDYKRVSELWNYQSNMTTVIEAGGQVFADAAVTTHAARIHKTKVNNMTEDEFERSNYVDRQLDKYFEENSRRTHYAIDKMPACGLTKKNAGVWDISKTFIIALRDMNHKCMGGKNSATYRWNIEEIGDMNSLPGSDGQFFVSNLEFASDIEKKNLVKFVYYGDEAKFVQKIFTALNCDGNVHSIAIPKVDWTHPWTVEEILTDYGYTEDEIKKVMEDLKKFKGMED